MTTMTTTPTGGEFSRDSQLDGIRAYIDGADYDEASAEAMAAALMAAFRDEIDERLPDGMSWQPGAGEFLYPVGTELPDTEELRDLFAAAWSAVEARYVEIEQEVLGTLPATVEELEQALMAIAEPVHRARVAGLLADAATARMASQVRQEAIFLATRERSREQVAELLGTGVPAVAKAIKLHNARYVI